MTRPVDFLGEPSQRRNPQAWEWLKSSKVMAVAWTAMRVWPGIMWIQTGSAKLWGAESAAFVQRDPDLSSSPVNVGASKLRTLQFVSKISS